MGANAHKASRGLLTQWKNYTGHLEVCSLEICAPWRPKSEVLVLPQITNLRVILAQITRPNPDHCSGTLVTFLKWHGSKQVKILQNSAPKEEFNGFLLQVTFSVAQFTPDFHSAASRFNSAARRGMLKGRRLLFDLYVNFIILSIWLQVWSSF